MFVFVFFFHQKFATRVHIILNTFKTISQNSQDNTNLTFLPKEEVVGSILQFVLLKWVERVNV